MSGNTYYFWQRMLLRLRICALPLLLSACSNSNPILQLADPFFQRGYGARYVLIIRSTWCGPDSTIDCISLIGGAQHFSPPIGATHRDAASAFWASGRSATEGLRKMAELGETGALGRELQSQIEDGDAATVFIAKGGIGTSPAAKFLEFTVHDSHPFLSFTTMLAPSPDWFTGLSAFSLLGANGEFAADLRRPIFAYDAGTDSAITFKHTNTPTSPQEPIMRLDRLRDSNPFVPPANAEIGEVQLQRIE